MAATADGESACDAERRILSLVAALDRPWTGPEPAKGIKGMPADENDYRLSEEERGTERTELHHFSQFPPPQVDTAMQLRALASMCNANDPHRSSSGQSRSRLRAAERWRSLPQQAA